MIKNNRKIGNCILVALFIMMLNTQMLKSQGICNTNTISKVLQFTEGIVGSEVFDSIKHQQISVFNGGFWVTGFATTYTTSGNQLYIAKFNDTGKLLLFKHFGTTSNENGYPISALATNSGGVVVSAETYNSTLTSNMTSIHYFDNLGNLKWSRTTPSYGNKGGCYDQFRDIYLDKANNDIWGIGTSVQRLGGSQAEINFGKFDSLGNFVFLKYITVKYSGNFLGSHGVRFIPTVGAATSLGDFAVLFWSGSGTLQKAGLMYVTKTGSVSNLWVGNASYGSVSISDGVFSPSGKSLYLYGFANNYSTGNHLLVAKINPFNYNLNWVNTYSTYSKELPHSIFYENDQLWITGVSSGISGSVNKRIVANLDTTGEILGQWAYNNPDNSSESFETLPGCKNDVAVLSNGSTVYVGYTNSTSPNITLLYTSPCSNFNCYFTATKALTKQSFKYQGYAVDGYITNGSSFPDLKNVTATSLTIKKKQLCADYCIKPKTTLKKIDSFCVNGSIIERTIQGNSVKNPVKYLWNDGDTNMNKTFSSAGKYYLQTSNSCGTILDSIIIKSASPINKFTILDSVFCNKTVNWENDQLNLKGKYLWDDGTILSTRTIDKPGKYWLKIRNVCNSVTDTFQIFAKTNPTKTLKSLDSICFNGGLLKVSATQLQTADGPFAYNWNNGTTDSIITFTKPGLYVLKTSNFCNTIEDSILVKPILGPKTFNVRDTFYCITSKQFSFDVFQPNCKYLWSNNRTSSSNTLQKKGHYWVKISNNCSSITDSFDIFEQIPPIREINTLDSICNNAKMDLVLKGTQKNLNCLPANYLWSTGESTSEIKINNPGKYFLQTSNHCGKRTDTINFKEILPPKPIEFKDTLLCRNPIYIIRADSQLNCKYLWSDGDTSSSKIITKEGVFAVQKYNQCGTQSKQFTVELDSIPAKTLSLSKVICDGKFETMNLTGFNPKWKYSWLNSGQDVNYFVLKAGDTLLLNVSSKCGNYVDSIIGIKKYCSPCGIYMPNAFTPFNHDQLNEQIQPISSCNIKHGYWSVYNSWGECILNKAQISQAWDGTYMGKRVQPGVYIYIVYGLFERSDAGSFKLFGNITILD